MTTPHPAVALLWEALETAWESDRTMEQLDALKRTYGAAVAAACEVTERRSPDRLALDAMVALGVVDPPVPTG